MEKFAEYGFNKSHSAAYALITYYTAWLKAHHPVEFMAALISSELANTDKVFTYINACREMQIPWCRPTST
jgi:DNA polymerase-3 subunit alpha